MKNVLLTDPYGPETVKWGRDMLDVMGSRLARGHGLFGLDSHMHPWALYIIAENISNPCTVMEHPLWDDFLAEIRKGYDVVGIQFKSYFAPKLVQMIRAIRRESPHTEIVVGGYGVGMLEDPPPGDTEGCAQFIRENADHLCRDEGVRFMRTILGDHPVDRPITQYHLPTASYGLPNLFFKAQVPAFLVSLGCPNACDFCNTSAFFYHKKIYVAEPAQIYEFMKHYQRSLNTEDLLCLLFDEDIVLNPDWVRELGRLIRSDRKTWGIRWFSFGSMRSISRFEPEELRECGMGAVWIGVESGLDEVLTTTDIHVAKRNGAKTVHDVFNGLYRCGIVTIGSMIYGFDFHTPENLKKDVEYFVSLRPFLYQIGVLTPCPGTKLYRKMVEDRRVLDTFGWNDMHLWKAGVHRLKHLSNDDIRTYYDWAHTQLNVVNGPPLVHFFESNLLAYKSFRGADSEFLKFQAEKSRDLLRVVRAIAPIVRDHAPSPLVRHKIRELEAETDAVLGSGPIPARIALGLFRRMFNFWMDRAGNVAPKGTLLESRTRWTHYHQSGNGGPPRVVRKKIRGAGRPHGTTDGRWGAVHLDTRSLKTAASRVMGLA
ncbi:MAG: radical SAM protein [Nitrospirae bacterium]|nr:radical SAM protein [Nitrospirota bacterium]